jgi:hypothetical protein
MSKIFFVFVPSAAKTKQNKTKNNAFRLSLSFHRKYICLIGYIGRQKLTSSGVLIHDSAGVLPLAVQALMATLIELFLNYKLSSGKGEPGVWVSRQTGRSKIIDKKIYQGELQWGGCSWIYANVFRTTLAAGSSRGRAPERGMPSPT